MYTGYDDCGAIFGQVLERPQEGAPPVLLDDGHENLVPYRPTSLPVLSLLGCAVHVPGGVPRRPLTPFFLNSHS